jgi:ABC-type transport system substrate-binding protein
MNSPKKASLLIRGVFIILAFLSMTFSLGGVAGAHILKVGLLDQPKTLNPFAARDIWSAKVIRMCYQPLYYRDPQTLSLVPWLAADKPVLNPSGNSVLFHLRDARWDDGTPVTPEDVAFTVRMIKRFRIPKYLNLWNFVSEVQSVGPRGVRLILERPMAILWERTLQSYVVQKSRWIRLYKRAEMALMEGGRGMKKMGHEGGRGTTHSKKAGLKKALNIITTYENTTPESCGPFVFKEWRRGSYIFLKKNKRFFALNGHIAGKKVGPYIDGVLMKIYGNMDTAILSLKKGDIDYLWAPVESGYLEDLKKDTRIKVFSIMRSGFKYMAFNLRKRPLNDKCFRKAVAYLVDKEFIVKRVLHNQGMALHTVVPPDNRFYFNPNTPKYGEGMTWRARVRKAKEILLKCGYSWDVEPVGGNFTGQYIKQGEGLRDPSGRPIPHMTLLTPPADYDAQRAQAGNLIQQWLRGFGIPVSWRPMAFGAMIKRVRLERRFDMFVSGWRTPIDPDFLRSFFHSKEDRPRGRNSGGYHNPEFDRLAELQAQTMDLVKRREIVWRLQEILMEDLPYIPLYAQLNLEAVRADRFQGWVEMVGGIGNLWTFLRVRPQSSP